MMVKEVTMEFRTTYDFITQLEEVGELWHEARIGDYIHSIEVSRHPDTPTIHRLILRTTDKRPDDN